MAMDKNGKRGERNGEDEEQGGGDGVQGRRSEGSMSRWDIVGREGRGREGVRQGG